MTGLGILLQETREAQGLTIEDMVQRTKIRADFLQALEQGDFERIPDPAYIRPFLRTYARALGLEEDRISLEFEARAAASFQQELGFRERRQLMQKRKRRLLWVRLSVLLLLLAAGGYLIYRLFFE